MTNVVPYDYSVAGMALAVSTMELYTVCAQQAGQQGVEGTKVLENGEALEALEIDADAANSNTISEDGMRMMNSLSTQTYMTSMNTNSIANEANMNTHNGEEQQVLR